MSATLRGVEAGIEKVDGESARVKGFGAKPAHNMLGYTFFSQVPILYGPYIAKISLEPASPELRALLCAKLDNIGDRPDAIREEVIAFFAQYGGVWNLHAQLCVEIEKMPIEKRPNKEWPEE